MDWIIGFVGSLFMAGAAYKKRSLTRSGALAAFVMGTVYFGSGSLLWFGLLLTFFITSTGWSKWKKRAKSRFDTIYEKTGQRDAHQVWANGGIGMLLCVANALFPHPAWVFLFVGVMATVNADTWATEIGSLSRSQPRSVITWRPVPAGTSGAVSVLGTWAAVGGAIIIGGAAVVCLYIAQDLAFPYPYSWYLLLAVGISGAIGGVAGAFTDSLLGATWQASYRCEKCGAATERLQHCDQATTLVRGFRWMTNDLVNSLSSIVGGLLAWLIGSLLLL
ncbi:DUF92 domain-containing protein [Paenibacillus sp. SC116]|uniref:DUF92 domain-containing protein n=1 Tax=Paenibacillus sp. SC116 TaxID=2968986 RepID=UPI00215B709C|nr:DUF92 domain-containing protein [Paenibacillus sp. SC116]MCR8843417.1 DUF92 domain-containing protein [Paenibacillus sp. SC116]